MISHRSAGSIRSLVGRVKNTPLHPQWFAYFREQRFLKTVCGKLAGTVLDIGCADAKPKQFLDADAHYVGIDYFATAMDWYDTRPDVFADAASLPLCNGSIDHVLLLDVLEHLPDPEQSLAEIHRVLTAGGTATLQVPFLYPVHDAPLDFHRWTVHGLAAAAERQGFEVIYQQSVGHPLETAALNSNIAMSKTVLNWIAARNPLALLGLLLPLAVLIANCLAWLFAALGRHDDMMPYAYRMTWRKA